MRVSFSFVCVALLVLADVAPASAAGHGRTRQRKSTPTGPESFEVVKDFTIPWPFRHRAATPTGDADGDGVSNDADQCPDTPRGATVDASGCPTDSDRDGVFDGIDRCPDTPKGAKVNTTGCPLDGDGDGVFDGIDKCPDTPKGAKVDATGCPSDDDGDGVFDGIDKCPNTPKGTRVDDTGCPVESSKTEMEFLDTGMIRTSRITFESGKADLKPESNAVLDEIGAILVQWPELEIEIGGHTDSQGTEALNQKLSEQRAGAVRDYLVKKFPKIDGSKLSTRGYGEGTPVASNDTAAGRAQNRRVEFTVLNKETLKREIERKRMKRR